MTRQEFAGFMAYLAAGEARALTEYEPDVWFEAIGDLPLSLARTAAARHFRFSHYRIKPNDVYEGVRELQESQRREADYERPALEPRQQSYGANPQTIAACMDDMRRILSERKVKADAEKQPALPESGEYATEGANQ